MNCARFDVSVLEKGQGRDGGCGGREGSSGGGGGGVGMTGKSCLGDGVE